jgi:ADP-ribose diphosphatase
MSEIDQEKTLPNIDDRKIVARSQFFNVEQVDLTFSNGATRQFERMAGSGRGGVMIVPLTDDGNMLLIREYAAGTHSYQLGFPKGLIDRGESPYIAANRELKEEVGFGAKRLHHLHKVSTAPTFFDAHMHILIGQDLYPESLPGDEPEPLDVISWPISRANELLGRDDFREARCIVALLLTQQWLDTQ